MTCGVVFARWMADDLINENRHREIMDMMKNMSTANMRTSYVDWF
jgi:hypothetical protein